MYGNCQHRPFESANLKHPQANDRGPRKIVVRKIVNVVERGCDRGTGAPAKGDRPGKVADGINDDESRDKSQPVNVVEVENQKAERTEPRETRKGGR